MDDPRTVDEITPDWLDRYIPHSNDGCQIEEHSLDSEFTPVSILADVVRVEISHSSPGCEPSSAIIKFPSQVDNVVAMTQEGGAYRNEAMAYGLLSSHKEIAVPRFYGYSDDGRARGIVTLIEDLSPAETGSDQEPWSVDVVAAVLERIAVVHAKFWGANDLVEPLPKNSFVESVNKFLANDWDPFFEQENKLLGRQAESFQWLRNNIDKVWMARNCGPTTFIHGDLHPANLLFKSDPDRPIIFVDWQLSSRGNPAYDVSYFMIGSLGVDDRRAHEKQLLHDYHAVLQANVDVTYPFERFFLHYRANTTRSMFRSVYSAAAAYSAPDDEGRARKASISLERTVAASADLDPPEAMRELGYTD